MPSTVGAALLAARRALRQSVELCLASGEAVALEAFEVFRRRLVWLVGVEQRLLLPALVARVGTPPFLKGMRRDHTDLVSLCAAHPRGPWMQNLAQLLEHHLALEERPGGLMPLVEEHLGDSAQLLADLARYPAPQLPKVATGAAVREALRLLLLEAGLGSPPWG